MKDKARMKRNRQIPAILLCAIGVAGIAISAWLCISHVQTARQVAVRKDFLARFGMDSDGKTEFVSLPKALVHNALSARLGEELFTDARALDGRLPRTVYNAIFADVYLHDGSVTGFPALVRHMIESPNHCAGGPISNVVARLSVDEKLSKRFQTAYKDGLTEYNVIDAFGQYQRTLFTSGKPFDHWCDGRTNALDAVQAKGFAIFRERKCSDCHYGPALGTLKVVDGKKVPGLRGISMRRAYLPDARNDLGAVLTLMPEGDVDEEERRALTAFLKTL